MSEKLAFEKDLDKDAFQYNCSKREKVWIALTIFLAIVSTVEVYRASKIAGMYEQLLKAKTGVSILTLTEQNKSMSSDRIFKVGGREYICHNNADFNYTTKTCYFNNTSDQLEK